jgi:dihydropteroate synthase
MKKITIGQNTFNLEKKTLIMGILNITPDSFSDGGIYTNLDNAISHAATMIQQGADIIDIGGESTRPGAKPVTQKEEIDRVLPVIDELLSKKKIPISIDTSKAKVAELAINHGACMVNDVTALRKDKTMAAIVSEYHVPICLMHMKGMPENMQKNPAYIDIIEEIKKFFNVRVQFCLKHQIKKNQIVLDPGIGFGKRTGHGIEDNCIILNQLSEFKSLGYPLMIGASRKQFIGNICGKKNPLPPHDRLEGSLAAACIAALNGANILRVHDVKETRRCLDLIDCIKKYELFS